MIIEIREAGFVNKGAELMLHAVLQKVSAKYPDARFVMAPDDSAPFEKRSNIGLYQKAWLWRYGMQWGYLAALVPHKIRKMYGMVLDREVDVVLDAAGFSYSDQWGISSSLELANSCKRWKRQGTKVILLPQALGPFTSTKIKEAIKTVADNADLIFARERISYEHLTAVVGERSNIKMAPDFTNLIQGIVPNDFDKQNNRFCIVPNYRMIDKTLPEESAAYTPFLIACAKHLMVRNAKPFIMVHEGANDLMLAEKISEAVGGLPIITESNPLRIKGILGVCEGTIGSRFHGLVSALSQGVPSLATGWSHKYKMLFEDYGFAEGLLSVQANESEIHDKIDSLIDQESKEKIKSIISGKSGQLKSLSVEMWEDVFGILGTK